jgi:glycosyltransferase involved in cell wall biosynthesis
VISIFVPTSGRPAMFRDMLKSLRETTFGYNVEVVAVIDADEEALRYAYDYCVDTIDYSPVRRGALWGWNKGLELSSGELFCPAGDDQIFHKDWLRYATEAHQDKLNDYGVVGMNDLAYNGNTQVATMWIFDRAWCMDNMGGIFAPPILHYYCVDLWWNDKAKMMNSFYWEERSVVEHLHSSHGKRPVDTTDSYKEDKWMEEDNRIYAEQKALGLPVTWESLI